MSSSTGFIFRRTSHSCITSRCPFLLSALIVHIMYVQDCMRVMLAVLGELALKEAARFKSISNAIVSAEPNAPRLAIVNVVWYCTISPPIKLPLTIIQLCPDQQFLYFPYELASFAAGLIYEQVESTNYWHLFFLDPHVLKMKCKALEERREKSFFYKI